MDQPDQPEHFGNSDHCDTVQPKPFTQHWVLNPTYYKQCLTSNWFNNIRVLNVQRVREWIYVIRELEFRTGVFLVSSEQHPECQLDKRSHPKLPRVFIIQLVIWDNDWGELSYSIFDCEVCDFWGFLVQCFILGECARNTVDSPTSHHHEYRLAQYHCD